MARSRFPGLGLLLFFLPATAAFLTNPLPRLPPPRPRHAALTTMQSLRDKFFATVDFQLNERFPQQDIQRVRAFVDSCKAGAIPPTAPTDLPFFQPSEEYVAGLTARPWHDPHSFPWVAPLEDASPVIQEELAEVLGARQDPRDFKGDSNVMTVMGAGWTALRLQRLGQWNEEVCARFPKTVALLASLDIPFAVRGVMFAR